MAAWRNMTTPCSANGRSAVAPPWSTPEPRRHSPYHGECPHGFMVLYPGAGGGARIRPPRSPRTTAGVDLGSCRGCTELGSRTGRLLQRRRVRAEGGHRNPFDGAGSGARWHTVLPVRERGRGGRGRPPAVGGDVVQEQPGGPGPGRRQGRDHR